MGFIVAGGKIAEIDMSPIPNGSARSPPLSAPTTSRLARPEVAGCYRRAGCDQFIGDDPAGSDRRPLAGACERAARFLRG